MKHNILKIGSRTIGSEELFFVIEEGQTNDGDFRKALVNIDTAKETGADAIEFQLARADDFYVRKDPGHSVYKRREFDEAEMRELVSYAKSRGLEFIAVPLSHRIVEPLAKAGCSGFNINASDLTNPDIIDAVSSTGLPFSLSLPLATEEEIEWAIGRINRRKNSRYALLHGQHVMASGENGVSAEDTSLGYISTLKKRYGVPIGFIDHTPLVWFPAAAVIAGADIVAKHLTLSRKERGSDWQVCLEPDEMKAAIKSARNAKRSINQKSKVLAPGENIDRSIMRRSIVAARAIKEGEVIGREDILFKRPGTGLCPSRYEEVIGKTAIRSIESDEQINLTDIGGKIR